MRVRLNPGMLGVPFLVAWVWGCFYAGHRLIPMSPNHCLDCDTTPMPWHFPPLLLTGLLGVCLGLYWMSEWENLIEDERA